MRNFYKNKNSKDTKNLFKSLKKILLPKIIKIMIFHKINKIKLKYNKKATLTKKKVIMISIYGHLKVFYNKKDKIKRGSALTYHEDYFLK